MQKTTDIRPAIPKNILRNWYSISSKCFFSQPCRDQSRSNQLSATIIIALLLNGSALADEQPAFRQQPSSTSKVLKKWKGHDLSAYGNRFKAILRVQAQELSKPDWSWIEEESDTVVVQNN
ncbi:MAG: hypothetical protein ACR2PG_27100 [Hyphomicrobiaceae bacterium]